ncbi:hypothetical protein IP88_14065 [alpha proteobacterium AAP81b]|nr:hypothetical protein IP88_14065 [alpha proteobacterium AAP81b]
MTVTLFEAGIGADRALVLADGAPVQAHFERHEGVRVGSIHGARLVKRLERRGIVALAGGEEALLQPLPAVTEGSVLRVEVVREALPEAGRPRLPKVRAVFGFPPRAVGELAAGPDLRARLPMVTLVGGPGPDRLEEAGWGEVVALAQSGHLPFPGGLLTITPTPAMTVIDVDGPGEPLALAEAAATAVARALRLFDIGGGIVVDFPSLQGRAARTRLDGVLAEALAGLGAHERTATNGFGLVQIVRPRLRSSLIEQVRAPGFGALELLRRAAREAPGPCSLILHPREAAWLATRPALTDALACVRGGAVGLRADPAMAIAAGDVVPGQTPGL